MKKHWHQAVIGLCCILIFSLCYGMIRPAVTLGAGTDAVMGQSAFEGEDDVQIDSEPAQEERDVQTDSEPIQEESDIQTDSKPAQEESDIQTDSEPVQEESDIQTDSEAVQDESDIQMDSEPAQEESDIQTDSESDQAESDIQMESESIQEESGTQKDDEMNQDESDTEMESEMETDTYAETEQTEIAEEGLTVTAEAADGDNWKRLRDSGWFDAYTGAVSQSADNAAVMSLTAKARAVAADKSQQMPSDVQVDNRGGSNQSADDSVYVSKMIQGTDIENVFDITLKVQTSLNMQEVIQEPDMAVVMVMDISNTMNADFNGVTRYAAAMTAAEQFLDDFTESKSLGISKIGYVAFNTNAHRIFDLQSCADENKAKVLKDTMRTQTGNIINYYEKDDKGNVVDHTRFTNIEAGLAMAADMLNGVGNKNKYIIFLSDGFPTTYIESGYAGYDPYDSTGRFYDRVLNKPCTLGTSYSDEAAARARDKAYTIKNEMGIQIFSIGVDIGGQTVQFYVDQTEGESYSVVDRTSTDYVIGSAESSEAYKDWLKNYIGSGYYYDSTDSAGLSEAYRQIFEKMKAQALDGSRADWVTADPMPKVSGQDELVEFIGFYDKSNPPVLAVDDKGVAVDLTGTYENNGENTASFDTDEKKIIWNLKQSGYQLEEAGDSKTYTFTLVYRVRLKNEYQTDAYTFVENETYDTNGMTTLQYRTLEGSGNNIQISDPKEVDFPVPSVHGYLAELAFTKVGIHDQVLSGAEFTLTHDESQCGRCRGDGISGTAIDTMMAISAEDGTVQFVNIPSGHIYILKETKAPEGYSPENKKYRVKVAYDSVTVTEEGGTGETAVDLNNWKIVNHTYYALPHTGSSGIWQYMAVGLLMISTAGILFFYRYKKNINPNQKGRSL